MVQILHRSDTKSGHWFIISTVDCKEGYVSWYDSSFNEKGLDGKFQKFSIFKYDGKVLKSNQITESTRRSGVRSYLPLLFVTGTVLTKWFSFKKNAGTSDTLPQKQNFTITKTRLFKYSRLSLSRLHLSRITAYLEVKIWSLF